ncbi:winged helix-turn-helix transcriptional regulator [soil metagenome]
MPIAEHPALSALPATKRTLLKSMKRSGEMTVEALAAAADLTVSATRQQLTGLQRDGLVTVNESRHGPGRPRHLYTLTTAADALYPRAYAELTNELLDYVDQADPELMEAIFSRRRQRRIESARQRLDGLGSFAETMTELAHILDDDGYLAEAIAEDDGGFRIVEHNCAILGIAMRSGQACGSELEFIQAVLPEATVERTSHILSGAYNCSYSVRPRVDAKAS